MDAKLIKGNMVKVDMKNGNSHVGKVLNVRPGWVVLGLKRGGNVHLELAKIKDAWEFGY